MRFFSEKRHSLFRLSNQHFLDLQDRPLKGVRSQMHAPRDHEHWRAIIDLSIKRVVDAIVWSIQEGLVMKDRW